MIKPSDMDAILANSFTDSIKNVYRYGRRSLKSFLWRKFTSPSLTIKKQLDDIYENKKHENDLRARLYRMIVSFCMNVDKVIENGIIQKSAYEFAHTITLDELVFLSNTLYMDLNLNWFVSKFPEYILDHGYPELAEVLDKGIKYSEDKHNL